VYHREKPDIIHQVAIKPILLGSLAASLLGCQRVVNAVVGGGYAFTSNSYLARILRPFLTLCLKFLLKRPGSKVVFENVDDLDSFAVSGLARREDSVLIRGAGVDPSQFQVRDKKFIVPIVVLVARLLWDKGIGEFVEAARILRLRGAKARFVIVGDPDFDNRACINSMTLEAWKTEGVIELWGFRSDIADVLTEANIACLPSYREGLPKSLLEAMAAGLPCITTDVPGCREAVRDGDNGLLVPAKDASALANAIEHLLLNPDVAQIMGTRGRERLEQEFSSRQVNEKTLTLYRELLSK
jgi:glycosyltransferase involved in cell wall biosynthesis